MDDQQLNVIEMMAGRGEHKEALLLLDSLEAGNPELADLPEALDLRARICAQLGEYDMARQAWQRLLGAHPGHPKATVGVAMLDRVAKSRWMRVRMQATRWGLAYGGVAAAVIVVCSVLLWMSGLRDDVETGFGQVAEVKESCAPGGVLFGISSNAIGLMTRELDILRAEVTRLEGRLQDANTEQNASFDRRLQDANTKQNASFERRLEDANTKQNASFARKIADSQEEEAGLRFHLCSQSGGEVKFY